MGFGRWGGWEPSSRGWEAPGGPPGVSGSPRRPKTGVLGWARGLGPPRAPLQVAPIFPVWETRILTYLGPIGPGPLGNYS